MKLDGQALALLREPNDTTDLRATTLERSTEALGHPRPGRVHRRVDHQAPVAIDRDQLEPLHPNLERALADRLAQQRADLLPGDAIGNSRRPQSCAHRREVDRNETAACPTSTGDVRLLDLDLASAAPPFRGAGGLTVLGFWGSLPARALGAGVFAGVSAGVSRESVRS